MYNFKVLIPTLTNSCNENPNTLKNTEITLWKSERAEFINNVENL